MAALIARFMGPTWDPHGSCRPQIGPMLAPRIRLSWCLLLSCKWDWSKGHIRTPTAVPINVHTVWLWFVLFLLHYNDVMMSAMASQITSLTIVYFTVYSGADQRKHQSSASLAFMRGIHRWPVNSLHKRPVTQKMFPFGDVIIILSGLIGFVCSSCPYSLIFCSQGSILEQISVAKV